MIALCDTKHWPSNPERRLNTVAQLAPSVLQRLPQFHDCLPRILQGYATSGDAARIVMWWATLHVWLMEGKKADRDHFFFPRPYAYRLGRALGLSELQSWAASLWGDSSIGFPALSYWRAARDHFFFPKPYTYRLGRALGMSELQSWAASLWDDYGLDFPALSYWQAALGAASPAEGAICARLWLDGPYGVPMDTSQNRQIAAALCKWLLDPSRHAMAKDFAACVLKESEAIPSHGNVSRRDRMRRERAELVYETCMNLHMREHLQAPEVQQALTQLQEQARQAPASVSSNLRLPRR